MFLPWLLSLVAANPNLYDPDYWKGMAKNRSCQSGSSGTDSIFQSANYNLLADVGFFSFTFGRGNAGQYAFQTFYTNNGYKTLLSITDCFCAGDMFMLYVDDERYPVIDCRPIPNDTCMQYSTDPEYCLTDETGAWCHNQVRLSPGFHNITIKAAVTVLKAGTGFLLLQKESDEQEGVAECSMVGSLLNPCNYEIFQ